MPITYEPERASKSKVQQANVEKVYHVTRADLPLCCPMPRMVLWNSHPRVYLPIEKTGEAMCPYCGAMYILKDAEDQTATD